MQTAQMVARCELDTFDNHVNCCQIKRLSTLIDSLDFIWRESYSDLELYYRDSAKIKRMTIQAFIFSYHQLNNQRLLDYPQHIINKINLHNKYLAINTCIDLNDILDNYILIDKVYKNSEINLLCKQVKQQFLKNRCLKRLFVAWSLSMLAGLLSLVLCLIYGNKADRASHRVFVTFAIITLISCVAMIVLLFSKIMFEMRLDNEGPWFSNDLYRSSNLQDIISHMVVNQALLKAFEQAVIIQEALCFLPDDILNEIIYHSIGHVKKSTNNFFDIRQQQMLYNYFINQHYGTEICIAPNINTGARRLTCKVQMLKI